LGPSPGPAPAGKKRVSCSRDIKLSEKKQAAGWGWDRARINNIHDLFVTLGRKLERISEDEAGLVFFVLVADPGIDKKE
jgi:hypothetical protein